MIKLQIKKKTNNVWQHLIIDGKTFILSDCYCKTNGDYFRVVEIGGSQRNEFLFSEIEVYDIGGIAETFTSSLSLMQRLKSLNYVGFIREGDVVIADIISSDPSNAAIIGTDGGLFVPIINADSDIIEVANLAALPATGEASKIYIDLATNLQYRWTGSAYVTIGGGTEVDIFNPYTSDYFVGIIRPLAQSVTGFTLSGFNNSWTVSGTLEANPEVSEYTLVGVKSATTSGVSCQFTISGNSTIRTYAVNRINKVIQWQIFRNSDPALVANARFFVGIINRFTTIGNTNPSTRFNLIGVGADSGDSNIQIIHNDESGVATKIDLGVNFPANTQNVDTYLSQTFFDIPNAKAYIRLVRLNTGHEVITEITTNLPAMSGGLDLAPYFWRNNGTTALEVKLRIGSFLQGQKIM